MHFHGIRECGVERIDGGFELREIGRGIQIVRPVFFYHRLARTIEREHEKTTRREFVDVAEMRARRGQREPADVIEIRVGIAVAADPRERRNLEEES